MMKAAAKQREDISLPGQAAERREGERSRLSRVTIDALPYPRLSSHTSETVSGKNRRLVADELVEFEK